jgi:heme/copper-type cytochrome/quinol oxidase subunit 3
MTAGNRWLATATALLVLAQIVHGAVPAETESDTVLGFYAGIALLLASIVALVGLVRGRRWAVPLATWTGFVVGVGFVLYHAIPFESPLTNPYPGEAVGAAAWLTVVASVAAGLWCGVEGLRASEHPAATQPAVG